MATLTKGKTFVNGELVTPQKLHELVDFGSVSNIVNADIASNAAIADTKLATISTANKVAQSAVTNLTTDLAGKAASIHQHAIADTTGLQTALDGKAASSHTHTIANVTGLQTALDGKQASGSYAPATGIAPSAITGTAVITTDSRLSDARTPTTHTHDDRYYTESEIDTKLSGLPVSGHTHTIADVTGLQTALDGKQASGSYAPATGIAPSAITGTAVITTDSRLSDARTPTDGSVTDAKVSATAAIADTKLATISTSGKVSNSATTATNANTANAIVARDESGNFSAGTITANLTGNATTATTAAACSGNAATATTLQTARTINGVSFDGSANITITANPNSHTHDDRYYTETEVDTLLTNKQKINGQTISAGLNWNGNTGIQFSNIPAGVQKFTLLVEIWLHGYSSAPGQGVVNIGTTTSGLITWNASGVMANFYLAAVNNIQDPSGFAITGGANTAAEHVGVLNFYVTNDPFNSTTKKRLICESHITQRNYSTGAVTILQGTGWIDYTGEINEFVLRPRFNSNSVSSAAARLYYYY